MRTFIGLAIVSAFCLPAASAFAQGRCIRAYGTPACNTDPIPRPFDPTEWRTTALEHITFRVADPQREAAFYAALMGWTIRSSDRTLVVMDIGSWGTVIFKSAPVESFAGTVHAAVRGSALPSSRGMRLPWSPPCAGADSLRCATTARTAFRVFT